MAEFTILMPDIFLFSGNVGESRPPGGLTWLATEPGPDPDCEGGKLNRAPRVRADLPVAAGSAQSVLLRGTPVSREYARS